MSILIPFNKPYMTGNELDYIRIAHQNLRLAGDGEFTKKSQAMLAASLNTKGSTFLTHSCTAALEIAAIAANIKPGDEIIMPSFTFVSTANAFALRGGVPIFVDIRADTQNINEDLIENAISKKTRAIVPVHYAGVSCEMDRIKNIAKNNNLLLIEDAAQGYLSKYKNDYLGSIGDYGTLSFHETKNIISGEGGAILVNKKSNIKKVEIIREKGTDRSDFFRGNVDKYTWRNIGSSFLPSEITAAFLFAQLEKGLDITKSRGDIWRQYHEQLQFLEEIGLLRRPVIPAECSSNSHIYYIVLDNMINRDKTLEAMNKKGVNAVSHYVPLHSSPAGKKFGKFSGHMTNTIRQANSLIRLPLWVGMSNKEINYVVRVLKNSIKT